MGKKMKRPLHKTHSGDSGNQKKGRSGKRPWWARSDDELVKDRVSRIKEWYQSSKIEVDDEDRDRLIEEAASRDPNIRNLLDTVPVRMEKVYRKNEYLMVPVYNTDRRRRIAVFFKLRTERRIRLDEYGWGVWELVNGRRDVRAIGKRLRTRFGERVEPLYPRLAKFIIYLQNLKVIEIRERGSG